MALDERIASALKRTIKKLEQPDVLANRLIAWLDALSSDPSGLDRLEEVIKSIDNVLDAVELPDEGDDEDDQ